MTLLKPATSEGTVPIWAFFIKCQCLLIFSDYEMAGLLLARLKEGGLFKSCNSSKALGLITWNLALGTIITCLVITAASALPGALCCAQGARKEPQCSHKEQHWPEWACKLTLIKVWPSSELQINPWKWLWHWADALNLAILFSREGSSKTLSGLQELQSWIPSHDPHTPGRHGKW